MGKLIEERARSNGDSPFIYFDEETVTFSQLDTTVDSVANGFLSLGVKKGDVVALLLDNRPEFVYSWLALSKIGAIEALINISHKADALRCFLVYCDAETVVIDGQFVPTLNTIADDLPQLKQLVLTSVSPEPVHDRFTAIPFEGLLEDPSAAPAADVPHDDPMAVIFTSETTGRSKGLVTTHNEAIFCADEYSHAYNPQDSLKPEVMCQYHPLFHVGGQYSGPVMSLLTGGPFVLTQAFSARRFWVEVRQHGCTVSVMFDAVLKILSFAEPRPDDADNPLRAFVSTTIARDAHVAFEVRFGVKLLNTYGLTGDDMVIIATYDDVVPGALGKPRGLFEVALFDENDLPIKDTDVGLLAFRPLQPNTIFEGYYKTPDKTLETFKNLLWHTGDPCCLT